MSTIQPNPTDVNTRTAQLVKQLAEVGPDIPEIARRLGQFKESVRYRYKEKILNKGFAVQASVDHEKLGLQRVVVVIDFAEEYTKYGEAILASMNEQCFLVSFARVMPSSNYIASFSVPRGFVEDLKAFFETIKEKGVFTKLEIFDFDWVRIVPMMSEFYDFDTGRWDFDWTNQSTQDFDSAKYMPSAPNKFDYADLLIIKELQMDANKSLKEISDKLNVNYKKLAWHYTTHVLGRRLIRGYSVNWMGTKYDYTIEKALHRQHRYFGMELLAKGLTEYEVIKVRERLSRIPFLWAEAVGKNYWAQLVLPVDGFVEALQFLTNALAEIKGKYEIFVPDQTEAASFTISYERYDQAQKEWTFDEPDLERRYEQLILKIKEGTD
jgi:hypothetical protein